MEKQLPKNWMEVQLLDILQTLENGSRPKGGVQGILEGVPSLGGEHLDSSGGFKFRNLKYVPETFAKKMNRGLIKENDILIVKDGATTGKTSFVSDKFPFKLAFVNEHVFISRTYPNINSKAIFYFLNSKLGQQRILENFTGSAQGGINQKFAKNTLIPLPPIAEQNRIVAKLDTVFTQLENIKTSMEKIPVLLKNFRQQVISQAVTGKLTEEWRKGKNLERWKKCVLLDVIIEKPRNGYSPKGVEYETSVKSLTLSATTSGKFNPSCIKYLDIEAPKSDSHLWLKNGDILIQRSNSLEYVGTSAIYDGEDFAFIYPDIMMKIKSNDSILNNFLMYVLSSQKTRKYYRDNASGTAGNMPKINQEIVSKTPIDLPSIKEQREVVNCVESLFAKANSIEDQYKSLKQKIDSLPQALLNKAFNGELTDQLNSDGDALDLLEEIKKLDNASKKINTKGKITEKKQKNSHKTNLVDEIKKILQEKVNGISYKELITCFYNNSQENLIDDVIQDLLIKNIISQEFNIEQKQMLIKINR